MVEVRGCLVLNNYVRILKRDLQPGERAPKFDRDAKMELVSDNDNEARRIASSIIYVRSSCLWLERVYQYWRSLADVNGGKGGIVDIFLIYVRIRHTRRRQRQ